MKYGVKSHKGMIREINEDSCNVIFGDSKKINAAFIVADGMGGYSAGEVASKMAVDYISQRIESIPENLDKEELLQFIEIIIQEANNTIYKKSSEPGQFYGMGTTLVIALFLDNKIIIGHVGDSRAYMVRNGDIKQLTTDHSYVEELIKNGSLTRGEAENHPKKHVITRALGCFEKVEADVFSYDIFGDDVFILCTDGLTNMISDDKIKKIVEEQEDPQVACTELVEIANKSGGNDNITVVVIRV